MTKITITDHAAQRMNWRKVTERQVRLALTSPAASKKIWKTDTKGGMNILIRLKGEAHPLLVGLALNEGRIIIKTVIWKGQADPLTLEDKSIKGYTFSL